MVELPIAMCQNHTGLLLCASDIADLQGGCMIWWHSLWDIWIMPLLVHAIPHVKLISKPLSQHLLRKVLCAMFFASAKHIGSGYMFSLSAFRPLLWPEYFVGIVAGQEGTAWQTCSWHLPSKQQLGTWNCTPPLGRYRDRFTKIVMCSKTK